MSQGVPTKVVAASMGLCGFAVTMIAGLAVDNPLDVIVMRSLVALLTCYVVGSLIGLAAEAAVGQRLSELENDMGMVKSTSSPGPATPSSTERGKMPTS